MVDGVIYKSGSGIPKSNPCELCWCEGTVVICGHYDCAHNMLDNIPDYCGLFYIPGQCCPIIDCDCVVDGIINGEDYPIEDPCQSCTCVGTEKVCIDKPC
ncbi:CLUMA_CG002493, isoform A [Clunio marinus]|uniref:CLUMA_CG002493, isoform A n=1 Tax=Clunio marinus TaxID=568069 RepID=A0A1J1HRM3_9DIPT|nr:CLUMA_CG002493, isoform A [Clunio marinus]